MRFRGANPSIDPLVSDFEGEDLSPIARELVQAVGWSDLVGSSVGLDIPCLIMFSY